MADANDIDYIYNDTQLNLKVCVPNDISRSPWKNTGDVSEQMLRSMIYSPCDGRFCYGNANLRNVNLHSVRLKLLTNTTLG